MGRRLVTRISVSSTTFWSVLAVPRIPRGPFSPNWCQSRFHDTAKGRTCCVQIWQTTPLVCPPPPLPSSSTLALHLASSMAVPHRLPTSKRNATKRRVLVVRRRRREAEGGGIEGWSRLEEDCQRNTRNEANLEA